MRFLFAALHSVPVSPHPATLAQHIHYPYLPLRSPSFPNASLRFQPATLSWLPHSLAGLGCPPDHDLGLISPIRSLCATTSKPPLVATPSSKIESISFHLALSNLHYLRARRDSQLLVPAFGRSVLYAAPLCATLSRSPLFDGISADCPLQLTGHPNSDTFLQRVEYRPLFLPRCFTRTFMVITTARCAYSQ